MSIKGYRKGGCHPFSTPWFRGGHGKGEHKVRPYQSSPRSFGTIRRRVYTSDFDNASRRSPSFGQSSQTALISRPVMPSDSGEASQATRSAALSGGVPPPERDRSTAALYSPRAPPGPAAIVSSSI